MSVNYYCWKRIAAAEEKKAEALMSIAQSLASRQNL